MPVLDMEFVKSLITYTEENAELIAKEVDEEFHHTKDFYRAVLRRDLRKYLDRVPVHYEWAPDDCPYDHSGILEEKGRIDMNQKVSDFLENEYTGNWTPSYTSGCGKYYDRYGDDFSYDGMMRAGTIMSDTMRRHFEKAFIRTISDEEMEEVMFECHDTIYDLCLASELFFYESVIEFYELGDILLKNL